MTGTRNPKITRETYIRHLPYSVVKYLSLLLDIDKKWERMVSHIPKNLKDVGKPNAELRYCHLQVRIFDDRSRRPDGSTTKSILDDWATQNARVTHLIVVLQKADLYEAANYILVNVLCEAPVQRPEPPDSSIPIPTFPIPGWDQSQKKATSHKTMSGSENETISSANQAYDKLGTNNEAIEYNTMDSGACGNLSLDSGQMSVMLNAENGCRLALEHAETVEIRSLGVYNLARDQNDMLINSESYEMAKDVPGKKVMPMLKPFVQHKPCETEDVDYITPTNEDPYSQLGSTVMPYHVLEYITNQFDNKLLSLGGRVIGSGGFGEVFLGIFQNGFKVAIKKLKNVEEVDKGFQTELDSLIKYRHKNIVRLYGYSVDGRGKCLIYEYLLNGSLEDRLMCKDNTPSLANVLRLSILKGTAEGICYLNTQGIVHRDIKSANVLLNESFEPKVGDFATARCAPRGNGTMPMSTSVVIGTSAYLAPEAMNFDVSTKLDSYSFGIIILEIMTALPPLDQTREEKDLKSYIEENCITEMLDSSGGEWNTDVVAKLMAIADKCTYFKKKQRANIEDILTDLHSISL